MAVWGGLTHSCEKKKRKGKKQISRERKHISGWGGLQIAVKIRGGKQRRKGKI